MSQTMMPPIGTNAYPPAPTDDADTDADDMVVCTICKASDGSYTVYAGDEPETGAGDVDTDGVIAGGGAGVAGAGLGAGASMDAGSQGKPAVDIGAALKAALDILQEDASSAGAPGTAKDQFNAGFTSSKAPTLAGPRG